jgi:centromere/kinetochore protein ZW10
LTKFQSSIRELSRLSAQDIDGWITQARQLRNDIDSSERQAAEIVNLAEKGKEAEAQRQNAHDKVTLLRTEVSFNERLLNTLQRVQDVKQTVNVAQEAVIGGNLEEGTRLLQESRKQLAELQGCDNTQLTGLIEAKLTDLENTLAEAATKHWKNLIQTDHDHGRITVSTEGSGGKTWFYPGM